MHRSKFKYSKEARLKMYEDWGFLDHLTMFTLLALFCTAWYVPCAVYKIKEKQDVLYELVKVKVAAAEEYPTSPLKKLRAISNKQSEYYVGDLMVMQGPMSTDLKPVHIPEPDFSHRGLIKK